MVARRLIGSLVEPPNEILEQEAHLNVVEPLRMEIDVGEFRYDLVEAIGLFQLLDLLLKDSNRSKILRTFSEKPAM